MTLNNYERMKHSFLTELNRVGFDITTINTVSNVLDRVIHPYELSIKETALSAKVYSIPQLVKTYLVVKKTECLSDGTLENYGRILKAFFIYIRKQPEEIEANDIRIFIYEYGQTRKISDRTLDKYRAMICWFFQWAYMEEYIPRNPAKSIKPIKHEVKERVSLTQIELEYLRMACLTKRERAMLEFLYSTGCRISEMISVQKEDINWQDQTVCLFGKGRKHRVSYLNAKCVVAIREYLLSREDDCPSLFITERKPYRHITKDAAEKIIRLLSARSNVSTHVTPHILRHTTATQAINNGMPIEDVSRLLGHANINTTMIYAKSSKAKIQTEHIRCIV